MDSDPGYTSDHKNQITQHCSSLVHTEWGVAPINGKAVTMELTQQHQTYTEIIRRKQRTAMMCKTSVLPTETQIQLHCE
jgi:hypothetical protein